MSIGSDIGAVVSGLLSKGPLSAPDLSALFHTIDTAGAYQKDLINSLPAQLQKQYGDYVASNKAAGAALQTGSEALQRSLTEGTAANYGPDAAAVKAANDAAKTAIYANLPGQQAAIRQALAATGGFDRGTASKQLAAPILQAGQQYSQAVLNTTAAQLKAKQDATQRALETVTNMGEDVVNRLFGMDTAQATAILNGNRQDLKDQLTDLINQSVNQTNQTLSVQGVDIQNKQNAAAANNAAYNAKINGWTNLAGDVIDEGPKQFNQAFSNVGALMGGGGGSADGGFSGGSTNPYASAAIQKGLIAAL